MDDQLTPAEVRALTSPMHRHDRVDSFAELYTATPAPTRGAVPISAALARQARDKLNLDADTMAQLMGVSRRSIFDWERKGVLSGPACVVYDLVLRGDLPERFIPTEDTKGRVIPTAD